MKIKRTSHNGHARIAAARRSDGLATALRGSLARLVVPVIAAMLLSLALAAPTGAAPRPAPTDLQVTPGLGSLVASWGVTGTSGLSGFRIRWRQKATPAHVWHRAIELGASARAYEITGLQFATYEVRVRALFGAARRNGAGGKPKKRLGGVANSDATPLASGEPPPEEEPPVEEEPEEEQEEKEEEQPPAECMLYASPGGRDGNSGAQGAPLRTVDGLLARLGAGQTGCLATGSYPGFSINSSHGHQGAPVTITSTDPRVPATITGRVVTNPGADWLTFSHLILTDNEAKYPSISIGSAHTSWLWDDVSAPNTICFAPVGPGAYGPAEDTLIEHDRIHDCGQPFMCDSDSAPCNKPPNDGYFIHGVYDMGIDTTIRNSYIYDVSSKGVLLRGGSGAVVEHNVIDGNGSGIAFGDLTPTNDTVAWNIVTNSGGPCKSCLEYFGIWSAGSVGSGNTVVNNDVFGNDSGNLQSLSRVLLSRNVEVDPQFVNAAKHDYTLKPTSPVLGYGPEEGEEE